MNPTRIKIIDINGAGFGLELEVEFTPGYPQELPIIYITPVSGGRPQNIEELRTKVNLEAKKSLGMAMVFSLVTFMEDWLADLAKSKAKYKISSNNIVDDDQVVALDNVAPVIRGGPVTPASFIEWHTKFLSEQASKTAPMSEISKRTFDLQTPIAKFTGRQLFERNRALATSDIAFAEDEGIVIAEEDVYEGLDDLVIDGDECFDDTSSCKSDIEEATLESQ